MDSECGASTEQSNVFRRWYKPKGVKGNIYCYYASQLGGKPLYSTSKWFNTVNYGKELLLIKSTRSNSLAFSLGIIPPRKDGEDTQSRKRKRPQNQESSQPGGKEITLKLSGNENNPFTATVSSSDAVSSLPMSSSYWDSTEAKNLF
jgi:hypothetical protein